MYVFGSVGELGRNVQTVRYELSISIFRRERYIQVGLQIRLEDSQLQFPVILDPEVDSALVLVYRHGIVILSDSS
jgi:hypothetical protein